MQKLFGFLILTLLAVPGAALAKDSPVLATYYTNNCCLPPEYAYEVTVTIHEDGALTLVRCEGYATEGPGCKTRHAKLTDAALAEILAAAGASGLAKTPAALDPDPPIGGGGTSGSVVLDGVEIVLPWNPAAADADRVRQVLRVIAGTFPAKLTQDLGD